HGRFYPVTPSRFNDERPYVEPGDLLGEVRNGAASIPVRSPFRGWVMAHLAWEGELVTPGQILLSLPPPPPAPPPPPHPAPPPPPEKGAVVPAEIVGLGVAVPPYVLTNADLEE